LTQKGWIPKSLLSGLAISDAGLNRERTIPQRFQIALMTGAIDWAKYMTVF